MSVSQVPLRPIAKGSLIKLWLAVAALIAITYGIAYAGAGQLRGETTASGLYFRTIKAGDGPLIQPVDGVMIEYEGRLADGTVFDSSEGRGPLPMIAGQAVPGFVEALSKMQKGGRYQVRIPGKLGYGASPPPGSPIPPNADLEFDVHVVEVVPNAALQLGAVPQQGR